MEGARRRARLRGQYGLRIVCRSQDRARRAGALQRNLVRSHAAGVGAPLPVRDVRAAMALRANVLAKGYSGIRLETLDALVALLNAGVHPLVPSRGSVGASGDLAPLAHIALVLIGEGEPNWDGDRDRSLGARETRLPRPGSASRLRCRGAATRRTCAGHAGTEGRPCPDQRHAAVDGGARAGAGRRRLLTRAADIAAAMSIDALRGSMHPFEARIHAARGFPGRPCPPATSSG